MKDNDNVEALMARMTLAEKIGQLNLMPAGEGLLTGTRQPTSLAARLENGQVGAIFGTKSLATARAMQERALAGSRLGIPLFFAEDVIHGHRTVFPLNIGLACSWDMDLIAATSAFAAAEAAAEGLHQVYAPTRKEVDHALEVIAAAEEAESRGLGVVSLNGKMIDGPIIDHARKVVALSASGIRD